MNTMSRSESARHMSEQVEIICGMLARADGQSRSFYRGAFQTECANPAEFFEFIASSEGVAPDHRSRILSHAEGCKALNPTWADLPVPD